MKAKKFFMIGLLTAGLAVSGFAAYHLSSSGIECCFPGCCESAEPSNM